LGYRILVTDPLAEHGLAILRDTAGMEVEVSPGLEPEALKVKLRDADAWIVRGGTRCTADLIAAAPHLQVIGRAGIGVDNIDITAATRRGIVVLNTPGSNATSAAEHALALMLAAARHVAVSHTSLRAGHWDRKRFVGRELAGKTLGVIGLGAIGRIVADRARGLKMQVVACDPYVTEAVADGVGARLVDLNTLLAESDVVTVHVPRRPETLNLIDAEALDRMKPGGIVLQCARGGVVDEAALADAVEVGHVFAAGVDVWEDEPPAATSRLLQLEWVVTTPRLGGATREAHEAVAVSAAAQVRDFLLHGVVQNAVNMPAVAGESLERIRQYQDLCRRTGALAAQLLEGDVGEARACLHGEVADLDNAPLSNAILVGLLTPYAEGVNAVSAPLLAEDRGLTLEMTAEADVAGSVVTLHVTGESGDLMVIGTLFAGNPRIIRIDGFAVEVAPEGRMLVHIGEDRAGLVGEVGTLLGEHGVSGTGLYAGVEPETGNAIALWNVDSPLNAEVVAAVARVPGMLRARSVEF